MCQILLHAVYEVSRAFCECEIDPVSRRLFVCCLVDPASGHMLVPKTKPCMPKSNRTIRASDAFGETADGSLNQS